MSMESSSDYSLTFSDRFKLIILRPIAAILFVLSFILIGWALAWRLVLVHVPLVQEIFGLKKKKQFKPKPQTGRLSKLYSAMEARSPNSTWEHFTGELMFHNELCNGCTHRLLV